MSDNTKPLMDARRTFLRRAAFAVGAQSEHLRATVPRLRADTGVALSTLGEQFSICESYLRVMRVRMGDRLRTAVILPDELRDVPFPPLMLISLVENAIKRVVTAKDEAFIRTPLKELITVLDAETFWQIHRSVIVRVATVHVVERDDGHLALSLRERPEKLPVSSAF